MEIFIAFTKESSYELLKGTLEAWDKIPDAEPVGIQVPSKKYEIVRRVTAENMAAGDYILCSIGCVPNSERTIEEVERLFQSNEKLGLIKFNFAGILLHARAENMGLVVACRKGIVERWPQNKSGSYKDEHELAYSIEGYAAQESDLTYHIAGVN